MSFVHILQRRAVLLAGVVALAGAVSRAGGQVPAKPLPKDTTKKQLVQPAPKPALSTPRIKVQKETVPPVKRTAGGEVALPTIHVDSSKLCDVVAVVDEARDDSVRAAQQQLDASVAAFERGQLMSDMQRRVDAAVFAVRDKARSDSIENADAQALALKHRLARGFYVGIGGGASAPQRDLRNGFTGGWNTTIPFGYDANDNPFGIRTDFSVDHLNGTRLHNQSEQTTAASGDLTVWSLNANLKLRFSTPGSTRTHLYVLGGGGAHRVTGGVYGTTDPKAGQNLTFANAKTNFGWNTGAGAAIDLGGAELFLESRFFQVSSNLGFHQSGGVGTYTSFTPFIVGLQLF